MSVSGLDYSLGAAARDRAAQTEDSAVQTAEPHWRTSSEKVPNRRSQAKKAWWDKKRREAEEAK